MAFTIAITGKGGVGKTTVAGLLVRGLIDRGRRPVLAVDADPNTCLDGALGVRVEKTVGGVREDARRIAGEGKVTGIAKQDLLNLKIAESLVEAENFDLIAMGRPEGPGCYCYANNVLRQTIQEIAANYPYVVIDNEAGLENLSRRIVQKVDLLVMVSDPSKRGLETVQRLYGLAREMEVAYGRLALVVNRVREKQMPAASQVVTESSKADYLIGLPEDGMLSWLGEEGSSVWELPADNPVLGPVNLLLDRVLK